MSRTNLEEIIRTDHPEDWACRCGYLVESLIRSARLALENDGSGISAEMRASVAADTLEVAEALSAIVQEGADFMERRTKRDMRRGREASPAGDSSEGHSV